MLAERNIAEEWVERTIAAPDEIQEPEVGVRHYMKRIPEHGERWLRVVVNTTVEPPRGITAFFDRRLKKTP
jgi:hypothetical protein